MPVRIATEVGQVATGGYTEGDGAAKTEGQIVTGLHEGRDCLIATERSVATDLVNAAYRVVAFTGSAPEPDRVLICLGLRSRNLPF
ncbi:hypothetical protein Taro_014568 [Colocasia esculenta]|uniref:Uncharacterized protein n=1 Tax=Colocasia esculenta TaxID=4460 RepID=A0A843U9D3_COLES|nr:hypothetical protein [Colocasia esculenta]